MYIYSDAAVSFSADQQYNWSAVKKKAISFKICWTNDVYKERLLGAILYWLLGFLCKYLKHCSN
jgi:hypothetical protein